MIMIFSIYLYLNYYGWCLFCFIMQPRAVWNICGILSTEGAWPPVINWEHLPSTEGLFQLFFIHIQHGCNNVCSSLEVPILLFIIIWECDPYAFLRCTTWVVSSCSERVNQGFLPLHTLHFSRFYIQFCSPFNNWSKVFKNHYFISLGDDFNTQLPVVRRFRLALAGFFCSKQWQPPGTRRNRRSTCGCVFRFVPRPNVSMTV